jgi:hypothetical protein
MKIKYLGEGGYITINPNFFICRKVGENFESLMYRSQCKAYLWDVMHETIHGAAFRSVKFDGKLEDFKDSVCIGFSKYDDLDGIKRRLKELESKLDIPETRYHVDGDTVICEANPLWITNLNMFSLYLATIRYSNATDKYGFDETIKHFDRVQEIFNKDKGKELKKAWNGPTGNTHYLGIYSFHYNYNNIK